MRTKLRPAINDLGVNLELMLLDRQLENFAEKKAKCRKKFWKGLRFSLDKFMRPNNSKKKRSSQESKFKLQSPQTKADEQPGNGASTLPEFSLKSESLLGQSISVAMEIEHPVAKGFGLVSGQPSMRSLSLFSEIRGKFKPTNRRINFKRDDAIFQQIRCFPLNQSLDELRYVAKNVELLCRRYADSHNEADRQSNSMSLDGLSLKFEYEKVFNDSFSIHTLGRLDIFKSIIFSVKRTSFEENYTSFTIKILAHQNSGNVKDELLLDRQLYLKIKESHDQHLKKRSIEFDYGSAKAWHPSFDLEFFYNSLGYTDEFSETLSVFDDDFDHLWAAFDLGQPIDRSKIKENSAPHAHLREKIIEEIRTREQLLASSTLRPDELCRLLDKKLMCEIAEHLKMTFQLRQVSNIYLSRLIGYFKTKIILSSQLDEAEIVWYLQAIIKAVPEWLSVVHSDRKAVLRMNHELSWPSVMIKLKSDFTNN